MAKMWRSGPEQRRVQNVHRNTPLPNDLEIGAPHPENLAGTPAAWDISYLPTTGQSIAAVAPKPAAGRAS